MTEPTATATRPPTSGVGAARAADQRVRDWVRTVLGEVALSFDAPGRVASDARGVGLYLMQLGGADETRSSKAAPLQFRVRYLVTTWGPDAAASHDDLCALAFAAQDTPDFEVGFEPLDAAAWLAFGVAPRPAFTIGIVLRKERVRAPAKPVRVPLALAPSAMLALQGSVLGPGDTPIAGARVELASLNLATTTDREGRFHFPGAPAERVLRVRVIARGVVQEFQTEPVAQWRGPLQLRMSFS